MSFTGNDKKEVKQAYFEGERPLFGEKNLSIEDTVFGVG